MNQERKQTMIKPVAQRFFDNLMLDVFPTTPAELVDFGFSRLEPDMRVNLYASYQNAARKGFITLKELSNACGDGPEITRLLSRLYPDIIVITDYD